VASKDRLVEGYARALFAVAQAEGALEDVEDELFRFARTMEAEGRLREALTDPALPPERKKAMLADLLGDRATPHTVNLLGFLVEQGRVRDLSRIVDRLVALAAEQRKRAVAEVRTAVQLTKEQQKRLAEALSKATGLDVELKVIVDESVLGGVVARVGDQVFDGTIRGRLEDAREHLGSV
jgi:F-type H+-transporting ATPase subunit delta